MLNRKGWFYENGFSIVKTTFLKIQCSNKYATLDWKLIKKSIKNNCPTSENNMNNGTEKETQIMNNPEKYI